MTGQKEVKGIKLLQDRAASIKTAHEEIGGDLADIKQSLMSIDEGKEILESAEYARLKEEAYDAMSVPKPLDQTDVNTVYAEAEGRYAEHLGLADILNLQDFAQAEKHVNQHVLDFNRRYGLDGWDYAIAGSCGLFAAMLDILCVKAPLRPTVKYTQQVNGIFNRWVQGAFNKWLPADLSNALSQANKIGGADSSVALRHLIGAPAKIITPSRHRLHSLAHDPFLGFIFGVWDMIHGTCTVVRDGQLVSYESRLGRVDGSVFQLLGRIFGHLLSDVNAPTANGNRGMGLPVPFMGLLLMLGKIRVGDSTFGRQIEWMFLNGYDFRQFVATSIPMTVMEVLLRAFYVAKQMKLYDAPFADTILDTLPGRLNPRFRVMQALAYGTSSAVNAGKMYVTGHILDASFASWMGLTWNGFHALKWALLDKHLKLWGDVESKEIAELEGLVLKMGELEARAMQLPT